MSEAMTLPNPVIPVERKCRIEEVFDQGFIELLRLVPRNPYIRALILKLTKKMPGPECETFEQVKEWVETNCEKKTRPAPSRATRNAGGDGISINVEFSETEYGRANYSVRRSGSNEFSISAEDLLEMVQTAVDDGEGIDEIVDRVAEKIDDDAWDQCDPNMDDYGDWDPIHGRSSFRCRWASFLVVSMKLKSSRASHRCINCRRSLRTSLPTGRHK